MNPRQSKMVPILIAAILVILVAGALIIYARYSNTVTDRNPAPSAETTSTYSTQGEPDAATPAPDTSGSGVPGVSTTAGDNGPDFTMTDANGAALNLSDFKGLPVILNFWASWCPPCRAEMDGFQKMYDKYGDQVNFVMVNVGGQGDTVASVQKFCKDNGYTFPVYFDTQGAGTTVYGVTGIPETVFLDAYQKSYGKVVGSMPEDVLARGMKILTQNQ